MFQRTILFQNCKRSWRGLLPDLGNHWHTPTLWHLCFQPGSSAGSGGGARREAGDARAVAGIRPATESFEPRTLHLKSPRNRLVPASCVFSPGRTGCGCLPLARRLGPVLRREYCAGPDPAARTPAATCPVGDVPLYKPCKASQLSHPFLAPPL